MWSCYAPASVAGQIKLQAVLLNHDFFQIMKRINSKCWDSSFVYQLGIGWISCSPLTSLSLCWISYSSKCTGLLSDIKAYKKYKIKCLLQMKKRMKLLLQLQHVNLLVRDKIFGLSGINNSTHTFTQICGHWIEVGRSRFYKFGILYFF